MLASLWSCSRVEPRSAIQTLPGIKSLQISADQNCPVDTARKNSTKVGAAYPNPTYVTVCIQLSWRCGCILLSTHLSILLGSPLLILSQASGTQGSAPDAKRDEDPPRKRSKKAKLGKKVCAHAHSRNSRKAVFQSGLRDDMHCPFFYLLV